MEKAAQLLLRITGVPSNGTDSSNAIDVPLFAAAITPALHKAATDPDKLCNLVSYHLAQKLIPFCNLSSQQKYIVNQAALSDGLGCDIFSLLSKGSCVTLYVLAEVVLHLFCMDELPQEWDEMFKPSMRRLDVQKAINAAKYVINIDVSQHYSTDASQQPTGPTANEFSNAAPTTGSETQSADVSVSQMKLVSQCTLYKAPPPQGVLSTLHVASILMQRCKKH
jgi:hypothetical protein